MNRFPSILAFALLLIAACASSGAIIRSNLAELTGRDHVVLLMYGDELSTGGEGGFEFGNSWGSLLKPRMAELLGATVSFINTSREQESFQRADRRLEEDILSYRPDIVLVMLGRMDAYTGVTISSHREHVEDFLGRLSAEGLFVVVITTPGLQSFTYAGSSVIDQFNLYNDEVRNGAKLYRMPLIDVAARFNRLMSQDPDRYESFFADNEHLSEEGKQYLADYVFERFSSVMEHE